MSCEERLEKIKQKRFFEIQSHDHDYLDLSDINWLEAEKVEQLNNRYDEQLDESQKTYDYFKNEIKRLSEALVIAHLHCLEGELDMTVELIRMVLDGEEVPLFWQEDLVKGNKALEGNK